MCPLITQWSVETLHRPHCPHWPHWMHQGWSLGLELRLRLGMKLHILWASAPSEDGAAGVVFLRTHYPIGPAKKMQFNQHVCSKGHYLN